VSKWIKIVFILGIFALIIILFVSMSKTQQMVVIQSGNKEAIPLEIKLGHFQDSDCGMVIDILTYASQVINKEGKTWFFHDHGGMVRWLDAKTFKDEATIWVWAKDTNQWINGKKAWYSRNDKTPMNYGFGAYEHYQNGFIDFEDMRLKMKRGENLTNPFVAKELGIR